jgi:hypothetical protein
METEEHDWIIDMGKYHIHQENYASPVFTRATEVSTAQPKVQPLRQQRPNIKISKRLFRRLLIPLNGF